MPSGLEILKNGDIWLSLSQWNVFYSVLYQKSIILIRWFWKIRITIEFYDKKWLKRTFVTFIVFIAAFRGLDWFFFLEKYRLFKIKDSEEYSCKQFLKFIQRSLYFLLKIWQEFISNWNAFHFLWLKSLFFSFSSCIFGCTYFIF